MNATNAEVSSEALTGLQENLRNLSSSLHDLYDVMNADMSQVRDFWQDPKYQEFVDGYKPQVNKCEEISQRYNQWCASVLQEAIDKVVKIEMADVGGGFAGGSSTASIGGATASGNMSPINDSQKSGKYSFKLEGEGTTRAQKISNGCGSEFSVKSQIGAKAAKPIDAYLSDSTIEQQNASCDQHDKDYFHGVPKEKADNDFQLRSPIMGSFVKKKKYAEESNQSYDAAQVDRLNSERLQPTWEEEHQQSLDSENYKVTPNKYEF